MSIRAVVQTVLGNFTFQSGYIQIKRRWLVLSRCYLYIPIWLYSNQVQGRKNQYSDAFTFQSGYIQIFPILYAAPTSVSFTFQSGYIQIAASNCLYLN